MKDCYLREYSAGIPYLVGKYNEQFVHLQQDQQIFQLVFFVCTGLLHQERESWFSGIPKFKSITFNLYQLIQQCINLNLALKVWGNKRFRLGSLYAVTLKEFQHEWGDLKTFYELKTVYKTYILCRNNCEFSLLHEYASSERCRGIGMIKDSSKWEQQGCAFMTSFVCAPHCFCYFPPLIIFQGKYKRIWAFSKNEILIFRVASGFFFFAWQWMRQYWRFQVLFFEMLIKDVMNK